MSHLKSSFAVRSKFEAFYTGGKIQVSSDGVYMFCGCGNKVNVLEVDTGKVHTAIGQEEGEEITCFTLTPNDRYVIIATQSLLLRQWDWREQKLVRSWKAIHFAPVVSMGFDCTSTLLATGSADSTIKIWDIEKQYCTHNLRGHQGIISVVAFHPDISRLLLYTAGEDYKIRVWNLTNSKCIAEIAAHYSLVTCIDFSLDGSSVYTTGRDGVVSILDTTSHTVRKTIPVFEVVESLVLLPQNVDYPAINVDSENTYFITAGNKGNLRLWNSITGKCVFTTDVVHSKNQISGDTSLEKPETEEGQNIVQMLYNKEKNSVTVVTYDQNISILGLEKLRLQKQFAGNNDEILDIQYFGEDEKFAVVATNSMHIKVFELSNCDCEILYGHTDIVLCIDVVKKSDMFISGAKDNTVRLWKINPTLKQVSCLAVGQGHTNAVGAVAVSRVKPKFFVSGSEDCTMKLWMIPNDLDPSVTKEMHAMVTERAHEKTISSVVVAPNDKFIASGSMDKTAKLWKASDLSLIGVMRGHKRGIWCVEFSPIDQILATSSGDGTVKLWSLTDFSCVRTFEGHDCAVLKVRFITRGMQILSSGTNGIVKLWTIKNNECVKTLDEHEDKVWALAVDEAGDGFITGAADSNLIVWKDVTETELNEVKEKQEQFILQEQELSNLVQQKKYLKAIGLAINLEQPFRLLNILKEILKEESGENKLHRTLEKLRIDQIDALLRFSVHWNTNSRNCLEAQTVLASVMKMFPPTLLKELGNLKSSVEGLLPYTERHFKRMSRLVQQSMFLEYTWQCMRGLRSEQRAVEPAASNTNNVDEDSRADVERRQSSRSESDEVSDTSSESGMEEDLTADVNEGMTDEKGDKKEKNPSKLQSNKQDSSDSSSSESEEELAQNVTKTSGQNTIQRMNITTKQKIGSIKDNAKANEGKHITDKTIAKLDKGNVKVSDRDAGKENKKVVVDNLKDKTKHAKGKETFIELDSDSSDSESDGNDDNDTMSSALSSKEIHRAVKDQGSSGKRLVIDLSLEDSSIESDTEDARLKSAESLKAGADTVDPEDEESMSESEDEDDEDTSDKAGEENIKKNLFKGYLAKKKQGENERRTRAQTSVQKRKITDTFTVVKEKTPKVVDMQYFIDKNPDTAKSDETPTDESKRARRTSQSRKTTRSTRLKSLKKPGGR